MNPFPSAGGRPVPVLWLVDRADALERGVTLDERPVDTEMLAADVT